MRRFVLLNCLENLLSELLYKNKTFAPQSNLIKIVICKEFSSISLVS